MLSIAINMSKSTPIATKITVPVFVTFYLRFISLITLGLGIGLLLWPVRVNEIFFDEQVPASIFFIQMTGSTLVGYGVLNWLAARRENSGRAEKVAVWSNLTTLTIATIVSAFLFNAFSYYKWLIVLQHAIFAAGFAYCAFLLSKK